MARIDPERGHIVVRLVYDGPAKAGKTTSLRQLGRSLGVELFSAAEEDGRTLYFDWLDYTGGLFEGMPIRCQILSVPGQQIFESRRRTLLESADAVVFVADSRREREAENRRAYSALRQVTAAERTPIGVVIQANKRDLPDALSLDELRDTFGEGTSLAMTEAIAERGEGVRETFVLGIRLALDRVRALASEGALSSLPPDFEDGAQLLAAMMSVEGPAERPAPLFAPAAAERSSGVADASRPQPPDAGIPPGLVWPPVHGRIVVHEAVRDSIHLDRSDAGGWSGTSTSGRWRLESPEGASFRDLERGREALIAWARWHASASARLSAERAIVLAPTGSGDWRLWQIVHVSQTLRDACHDLVRLPGRVAGERLFDVIDLFAQALDALVATGIVEDIALDTVAVSANGSPVYAGPAAYPLRPHSGEPARRSEPVIERELLNALRSAITAAPWGLTDLLAGFDTAAARRGRTDLAQSLRHELLHR